MIDKNGILIKEGDLIRLGKDEYRVFKRENKLILKTELGDELLFAEDHQNTIVKINE